MTVLRVLNLMLGSVAVGSTLFGFAVVPRLFAALPPEEARAMHRLISRRVDTYIPATVFLTMATGYALVVFDRLASQPSWALTLVGAGLINAYGLPFLVHRTGARNDVALLQVEHRATGNAGPDRRYRWWIRWHVLRTIACVSAQGCFVVAAVVR